jgi:hypothetical protein
MTLLQRQQMSNNWIDTAGKPEEVVRGYKKGFFALELRLRDQSKEDGVNYLALDTTPVLR